MSINRLTPRPSNILFINEEYLKSTTTTNLSVDASLIRQSIQFQQDRYILPLLGNNIFEQFKDWIATGATFSANSTILFDSNNLFLFQNFVQPCLAAATMMELIYDINVQIRNKGLEQAHSEFSTNATDAQVDRMSERFRQTAAFYAQRCTQFLTANPDIWPNWLNPQIGTNGTGADLFYPQSTKYTSGIFVPGLNNSSILLGYDPNGIGWGLSTEQRRALLSGNL